MDSLLQTSQVQTNKAERSLMSWEAGERAWRFQSVLMLPRMLQIQDRASASSRFESETAAYRTLHA